jgi:hypothetical protein
MATRKFDLRISLRSANGSTDRINLCLSTNGRWQVFRNGKTSSKLPEATSSEIAAAIRQWLAEQSKLINPSQQFYR